MPSQILSADAPQRCTKYPEEDLPYSMEFSRLLVPAGGSNPAETISSIVSVTFEASAGASALTISGQAIVGSQVQMLISAGQAGANYRVIVLVQTSLGYQRQGKGRLSVVN